MKRLTNDNPKSNMETLLNYAYAKDGNAVLRYGDGENNIDLCEYTSRLCNKKGCQRTPDDIMEDGCFDCGDCEVAILYSVAVQAAELRGRLKKYESALSISDTECLSPEEVRQMRKDINLMQVEIDRLETECDEAEKSAEIADDYYQQAREDIATMRQKRLVELVTCSECKYRRVTRGAYKINHYNCDRSGSPCRNRLVMPNDYCAHGVRESKLHYLHSDGANKD